MAVYQLFSALNYLSKIPGRISDSIDDFRRPSPFEVQLKIPKSKLKANWNLMNVIDQECSLFRLLTQDVRLIIWTHVLGAQDANDVIHLDIGLATIISRRCLKEGQTSELGWKHACWEVCWTAEERRLYPDAISLPSEKALLPLLRSCKQVFNESIHILYAANIFDVRRAECLSRLPKVMTSQNINSIRSLRFSTAFQYPIDTSAKAKEKMAKHLWWQPPDDAATWPAACMVLGSMNLEHLSVMIGFWVQWPKYTDIDDNVERSMLNVLQPLTGITASRYNVVLSTEVPEEVLSQLGPLPFTLGKDDTPDAGFVYGIHYTMRSSV